MNATINNIPNCEVHVVIRFLLAKNNSAAEIHMQFCEVHEPNVRGDSHIRQRCNLFQERQTKSHDKKYC